MEAAILLNPRYHKALSILKGFRNGAMYGLKVRLPHSLVTTLLFHNGSLREKLTFILRATFQHSKNLAFFVSMYRSLMWLCRMVCGENRPYHTFIMAGLTGYVVFGENNPVNMQVNLYLLSRITAGFAKVLVKKGYIPTPQFSVFPWFAAFVWAMVLCLYEYQADTLQPSLQNSMNYLYRDSSVWSNVWDFFVYNSSYLW